MGLDRGMMVAFDAAVEKEGSIVGSESERETGSVGRSRSVQLCIYTLLVALALSNCVYIILYTELALSIAFRNGFYG